MTISMQSMLKFISLKHDVRAKMQHRTQERSPLPELQTEHTGCPYISRACDPILTVWTPLIKKLDIMVTTVAVTNFLR